MDFADFIVKFIDDHFTINPCNPKILLIGDSDNYAANNLSVNFVNFKAQPVSVLKLSMSIGKPFIKRRCVATALG